MLNKIKITLAIAALAFLTLAMIYFLSDRKTANKAAYLWPLGTTQKYQLSINSTTYMAKEKKLPAAIIAIKGKLLMHIFSHQQEVEVGFKLSELEVLTNGETDKPMQEVFAKPFFAKMTANGRFKEFYFDPNLALEMHDLIKGLVLPFEALLTKKDSYRVEQTDGVGKYLAQYQRKEGAVFTKEKKHYLNKNEDGLKVQIKKALSTFKVSSKSAWLANSRGEEALEFLALDDRPLISIRNSYSLQFVSQVSDQQNWLAKDLSASLELLNQAPTKEVASQGNLKAKSAKTNNDLIKSINKLSKDGSRESLLAFRRYLKHNPEEITKLPELFLTEDIEDKVRSSIINSLGLIGIPQAQQTLTRLLDDSRQKKVDRFRAAISFASLEQPLTPGTKKDLLLRIGQLSRKDEMLDINSTAVLALGTIAQNLRKKHPSQSKAIGSALTEQLENASTIQTKYILKALGNTADTTHAATINNYLNSQQITLRRAAAESFRYMPAKAIKAPLFNRLEDERDSAVVSALADSLNRCSFSSKEGNKLFDKIREEKDSYARQKLISLWVNNTPSEAKSEEKLRQLLKNEDSKVNRQLILQTLSQD